MERLLSCKEVSEMLGYHNDAKCRFVRDLRRKGILEGARIGKKLMFKESSVEEYIEHQFRIQNKKRVQHEEALNTEMIPTQKIISTKL